MRKVNLSTCHRREPTEKLQDGLRFQIHALNLDSLKKKKERTGQRHKKGSYFSLCRVYLKILDGDARKHGPDRKQTFNQTLTCPPAASVKTNGLPSRLNSC